MARYFTEYEVQGLDPVLVGMLDEARHIAGVPFVITSGYRAGDPRPHGHRVGVDLRCRLRESTKRSKMVFALRKAGFRRIGIYNKHVHADISIRLPQDVLWWGKSK